MGRLNSAPINFFCICYATFRIIPIGRLPCWFLLIPLHLSAVPGTHPTGKHEPGALPCVEPRAREKPLTHPVLFDHIGKTRP
jgi:hypothetical protein